MSTKTEKYDALVDLAYEQGETVESYGNFDDEAEEGHDVQAIEHCGLWLVVERQDEDESISSFTNEDEALDFFNKIAEKIEDEEEAE